MINDLLFSVRRVPSECGHPVLCSRRSRVWSLDRDRPRKRCALSVSRSCWRVLEPIALDGKRVLIIIPDGTCTAPILLLFRLLHEQIGRRVARLDYLIVLGTRP